jgi:cysteine synthase A
MSVERFPKPSWVVVSAGTGGTSATIGRYLRHQKLWQQPSQLCVVDPENSVFYDYYKSGDAGLKIQQGSRIEGIGRPRVEPSFEAAVIDKMLKVDDNESLAAAHFLSAKLGRLVGGSTGTNFVGVLALAKEMQQRGEQGSIVTLICDGGDRYQESYFNHDWLLEKGYRIPERVAVLQSLYR